MTGAGSPIVGTPPATRKLDMGASRRLSARVNSGRPLPATMRIFSLLLLPLVLAQPATAQIDESAPLPEGAVALLDGDPISKQAYMEYLYDRFGKRGVREMVADMLVEREAKRYGVTVAAEEVQKLADEREEASRRGMDDAAFRANLERDGRDYAMYRRGLEKEVKSELMLRELVMQTRVASDDKITLLFERKYGLGGVRMKVRHVLAMPNILRAEKVRAGANPADLDMEKLRQEARGIAERARERLGQGEEFATVAAELSHDRVTKDRGGEIQNYNGRLYGPAFRNALDAIQPGQVTAVVESGAGFHVIELLERSQTTLESVRRELVEEILAAEPTFQEMAGYRNALVEAADVRLF